MNVTAAEWDRWEAERDAANRAYAKAEHARKVREQPQRIEALVQRVEDLEVQVYVLTETLAAMGELMEPRKRPPLRIAA